MRLPKDKLVGLRVTTGPVPVPLRLTDCWLLLMPLLLSVMTRLAVRLPERVGAKVTLIVQLLPAASELPQELVSAKSPGSVPEKVTLLMLRAEFPVLLSVTVWAALVVPMAVELKVRLVGETLASGALPVPVRLTVCELGVALSVMLNVALKVPEAVGANVTLNVQLPPAATELLQLLVSPKSPGLVPVNVMPIMAKAALPVLLRVTVCAALVVWAV